MLMATMLARMPDLRERVQADHVADAGGCCQECREDTQWPCELYWIATTAESLGSTDTADSLPSPRAGQ